MNYVFFASGGLGEKLFDFCVEQFGVPVLCVHRFSF